MYESVNLRIPTESNSTRYTPGKSLMGENFAGILAAETISKEALKEERWTDIKEDMVMRYQTSDGKKGELYWNADMLACVGGTGGTIHAKYHEDSTREDPMVIVWGVDISGKNYEKIIHLNDIDPRHATPAEMIALHAHLAQQDEQNMENPIALWVSKGMNVTSKMDYEQYYKNYIAMQQKSGNRSGAALYQIQLERLLFSCLQK